MKVSTTCIPKKSKFGITKNYRDITLTAITAKVYKPCFQTESSLKLRKFLEENRTVIEEIN